MLPNESLLQVLHFVDYKTLVFAKSREHPSLETACRELEGVIGPHAVTTVTFAGNALDVDGIGAIFKAAPALKFAEYVDLSWSGDSNNSLDDFMQSFAGMKALCLLLGYDTFRQLGWTFLRQESARELRRIKVIGGVSGPTGCMHDSVKELVRTCVTLPHLQGGEPLLLDFPHKSFPGAFGLQIIEVSN
ncbi:hypothetical protein AAVH_18339 [Aphelenchoides avenae]|nr:hypothetical protein AAVH_18339 [Aphelenchus avenae]